MARRHVEIAVDVAVGVAFVAYVAWAMGLSGRAMRGRGRAVAALMAARHKAMERWRLCRMTGWQREVWNHGRPLPREHMTIVPPDQAHEIMLALMGQGKDA